LIAVFGPRSSRAANGVRLGRKPTLTYHQQREAIKRLNAGKETRGEIARSFNVSRCWTISRRDKNHINSVMIWRFLRLFAAINGKRSPRVACFLC
jgi:DNA invertase Pin-like site-specific DNA recombinase